MTTEESQTEIDRLRAESVKLAGNVAALTDELREVRAEARDRRHENKNLLQQRAELTADRDHWKTQAETSSGEWQARVDDLFGKLRVARHDRAYEQVARMLHVTDATKLADLLKLAGHTPDTDEPDEEKIAQAFQDVLKDRPWLVDQPTPPAAGAATDAPGGATGAVEMPAGAMPGPGSDRGQSLSSGAQGPPPKGPAGRL